jgi:molybdopterin-guanine dinucleotide biosynthesis protein B
MARPSGLAPHVAWLDLSDPGAVLTWIRNFNRLPA